jgi:hypothetical protein
MLCVRGGMRWAVVAAVTLVVIPRAHAQQNTALPGVQMIELDGRAVRVQTIGLQGRRPGTPVIVIRLTRFLERIQPLSCRPSNECSERCAESVGSAFKRMTA